MLGNKEGESKEARAWQLCVVMSVDNTQAPLRKRKPCRSVLQYCALSDSESDADNDNNE